MTNQDMPGEGLPGGQPGAPMETAEWKEIVRKYQQPSIWGSLWQIANTLGSYALLWVAMYFALAVSYWLVVPLAILAGAFLVRAFIIFHDCTHGSFFKSRRANDIWGFITGVLTFTPYHHWRWEHTVHHSSAGNLDRRGMGDVWTLKAADITQKPQIVHLSLVRRKPLQIGWLQKRQDVPTEERQRFQVSEPGRTKAVTALRETV